MALPSADEIVIKYIKNKREMEKLSKRTLSIFKQQITEQKTLEEKSTPSIGESWDKRRKRLATTNKVSKFTRLGSKQTTMTFTGQLLKSLKIKIVSTGLGAKMEIYATGNHKKYKSPKPLTKKDGTPYKQRKRKGGSGTSNKDVLSGYKEWFKKKKGISLGKATDSKLIFKEISESFKRFIRRGL
jgi:hypothetical protein